RYVAGIPKVRDCTAGFRAIRTSLLRKIDFSRLRVQGYGFQVALLHAAVVQKGKVVEIPVDFIDRTYGESKLGLRDIFEFILNAWWIRFNSLKTFLKFLIVGASGVVVNLGFFTLFLWAGMNKYLASPIAIEISIISNFLLNNYWTFRWRKTKGRIRHKGLKFNAVSLVALGVSYSTFVALSIAFPDLPPQFSQFIGIIPATVVNYFLNSYWTFKPVEDDPTARTTTSEGSRAQPAGSSPTAFAATTQNSVRASLKEKKFVGPVETSDEALSIASQKNPHTETSRKQKIIAAFFLFILAIFFHAPHFIFFKSETTIDFYLHYNWTKEFIESMQLGDVYPRWVYHGHYGLGEPAFLFYSPLYYWLAGLFSLLGGTTWLSMHLVEIASSTIFAWFIFLTATYYVRFPLAIIAGGLALFNPFYIMLQYKFHGFPWAIAFAAHGLLLWSLLRPRSEHHFINLWAAMAIGLATLSHTVSTLIALICFTVVAIVRLPRRQQDSWINARSVLGWLATTALGLSLSAVYLLPALASMKLINSAAMTKDYVPWSSFSFPVFTRSNGYFWFSFQWPVSVLVALMILVPAIYVIKKMRNGSKISWVAYLLIASGLTALFFSSELSYPLWLYETPLRKIQFP
ncbi:hypothetical protein MTYM_00855, partial [Methylococcales bacterium]